MGDDVRDEYQALTTELEAISRAMRARVDQASGRLANLAPRLKFKPAHQEMFYRVGDALSRLNGDIERINRLPVFDESLAPAETPLFPEVRRG